jgi:hypothetical protein
MRPTIATAAFAASTATTGAITATALLWAIPATLGLLAVGGWVMMALTSQGAFRRKTMDEKMQENRMVLSRSRPQPPRRSLAPLRPSPRRNGHRKRRDVLVGMPGMSIYPGGVERQ